MALWSANLSEYPEPPGEKASGYIDNTERGVLSLSAASYSARWGPYALNSLELSFPSWSC